jgi:integrase
MRAPGGCELLPVWCFIRPGEFRYARWREFDLAEAVWRIPAETMKKDRPHRVPLARQSITLLRELHKITGSGEFVFPAITSVRRPMSENTLNAALRRRGYAKHEMMAAASGGHLQLF